MSWKQYVDSLMSTNLLNFVAIIGNPDGKIYASSPGFKMTDHSATNTNEKGEQIQYLVSEWHLLKNLFGGDKIDLTKGFWIDGKKYVVLSIDGNVAYFRCEHGGMCIVKTHKTFVVGGFTTVDDPKKNGGACNSIIEDFALQLMESKF